MTAGEILLLARCANPRIVVRVAQADMQAIRDLIVGQGHVIVPHTRHGAESINAGSGAAIVIDERVRAGQPWVDEEIELKRRAT